jgi:hypothetical protein
MIDDRSRQAIMVLEDFIEGRATREKVRLTRQTALEAYRDAPPTIPGAKQAAEAAREAINEGNSNEGFWVVAGDSSRRAAEAAAKTKPWEVERRIQVGLIHDIFGNPFKPRPTIDPAWLRWNDETVPRIARSVYEEHRFGELPILHDALLDAGCDDQDILDHCQAPGPHVRGCWVLDLLLGKE